MSAILKKLTAKNITAKSDKDITATFELITPKKADIYLESNLENQRTLSRHTVNRYVLAMKAACWKINGEAIKFDSNGKLVDGQHRLSACSMSNIPIETLVIRGLDPDVLDSIDTGRNRTAGDVLKMLNVKQHFQVSAGCRTWLALSKLPSDRLYYKTKAAELGISNHDIKELYLSADQGDGQNHWEKSACFVVANYPRIIKLIGPSLLTFLYHFFTAIDHEVALDYFRAIEVGIPKLIDKERNRYCPTTLVKEMLVDIKLHTNDKQTNARYTQHRRMFCLFEGWNYFVEGQCINKLTTTQDAQFPEVKNSPIVRELDLFSDL